MTSNEPPGRARTLPGTQSAATLIGLNLYTIVATGALLWGEGLPTGIRISLALPILVFIPGYALLSALVPAAHASNIDPGPGENDRDREQLRSGERGVLAVVASVALVSMVALVVAYFASVDLTAVLAAVAGVTLLVSVVSLVRAYTTGSSLPTDRATAGGRNSLPTAGAVLAFVVTVVLLAVVFVLGVPV